MSFTFTSNAGQATLTDYTGTDTIVVIPDTYLDNPVTAIAPNVFKGKDLTGVTYPKGLKTIGASAFEDNFLTGPFSMPRSVTSIGEKAYKNAGNFTTPLVIPQGTIGANAFEGSSFTITLVQSPPTFDAQDEPYQLFYANRQYFPNPELNTLHNYGIFNGTFIQVMPTFTSNVTKPFSSYHNIVVNSINSWSITNIAPVLSAFDNAYVEVYLQTEQTAPRWSVTYNNNTTVSYSLSGTFNAGSWLFYTGTSCPSQLSDKYPVSNQVRLSTVVGTTPSSIKSIVLRLDGNTNNLNIINIGHVGVNNQYLLPCEWTAVNYTYHEATNVKTYSVVPISQVDVGQQLVLSNIQNTEFKDNNASTLRVKDIVTNGNGLRFYGLSLLSLKPLDLTFYQGNYTALDTTKPISMYVIMDVIPNLAIRTECPSLILENDEQITEYTSTTPIPIVGNEPYKVLLYVASADDTTQFPNITQRIRLTTTGPENQSIERASVRVRDTTCKAMVLLTGGISMIKSNRSSTTVINFGAVQYSLVVPIKPATNNSSPQIATVRLNNTLNQNNYANMYTQSIPLSSAASEVIFPMMAVHNNNNLVVEYAYANDPSNSTSGSMNLSLLGLQLVRDGPNITGTETVILNCAPTVSSNNILTVNVTKFQNTNLNRIDGLNVYLGSINPSQLIGDITSVGTKNIDLTNVGWTSGTKTVYFVPYRDANVLSAKNKYEYDTVNQILTKIISRV